MTTVQTAVTPLTVPALLADQVRASGQDTYVSTPDGKLTYQEADARSADIACRLLAAGVGKGSRVGLFFPNGIDWISWWLALSRIGALVVPLSTLYAPAEVARVLRLADVATLISPAEVLGTDAGERFEAALPELRHQDRDALSLTAAPYLRRIVLTEDTGYRWATRWHSLTHRVSPHVLAAVQDEVSPQIWRSWCTRPVPPRTPRACCTHGTLVRQTSSWPAAIRAVTGSTARPRILCAMPFFWIGGLLGAMGALHDTITLLVMARLDPETALDLVESNVPPGSSAGRHSPSGSASTRASPSATCPAPRCCGTARSTSR